MDDRLELKLTELGISIEKISKQKYNLSLRNDNNKIIQVLILNSETIDKEIHGSRNGNVIQGIGYFRLGKLTKVNEVDLLIMAFNKHLMESSEYIIIPANELKRRKGGMGSFQSKSSRMELLFWLMPDGGLYETCGISPEGEWYFLSKGINGRMADRTDWCYSQYFNNWNILIERFSL